MADFERQEEERAQAQAEDKHLKSFEQSFLEMIEQRKRGLRAIDEETGLPLRSPRQGGGTTPRQGGGTTPRQGGLTPRQGITPRSYYQASTTPRGFSRLPATPSSVLSGFGQDGLFKTDDMPPEEFSDALNKLDALVNPQDGSFKSLSDALSEPFDIGEVSTLTQRLKNLPLQPYRTKDMHALPLFLLTKRLKKCKTCLKILVKPSKDLKNSNNDGINFLLRDIAPKVTIYRFGKYQ